MKRVISAIALVLIVLLGYSPPTASSSPPREDSPSTVEEFEKEDVTTSTQQAPYVFESEEEIQYYAYQDMTTADKSLHPLILEARRIIIYRYSWVADEVDGWIKDKKGNIIETLPHFSDLFPDDWEIPIESVEVDLSYYGR